MLLAYRYWASTQLRHGLVRSRELSFRFLSPMLAGRGGVLGRGEADRKGEQAGST